MHSSVNTSTAFLICFHSHTAMVPNHSVCLLCFLTLDRITLKFHLAQLHHVRLQYSRQCLSFRQKRLISKHPRSDLHSDPRGILTSQFLMDTTSSCAEQISPGRKSDTGTAQRIRPVFKIIHPVQTTSYIWTIYTIKTDKKETFNYIACVPMAEAQIPRKNDKSEQADKLTLKDLIRCCKLTN